MVVRRFSSAKVAMVIMGTMNRMMVLRMPKKFLSTSAGTSMAGLAPPNCWARTAIIMERWIKTDRIL